MYGTRITVCHVHLIFHCSWVVPIIMISSHRTCVVSFISWPLPMVLDSCSEVTGIQTPVSLHWCLPSYTFLLRKSQNLHWDYCKNTICVLSEYQFVLPVLMPLFELLPLCLHPPHQSWCYLSIYAYHPPYSDVFFLSIWHIEDDE